MASEDARTSAAAERYEKALREIVTAGTRPLDSMGVTVKQQLRDRGQAMLDIAHKALKP